jgi:hypothetical protein
MLLLLVPLALAMVAGVLALASHLEQQRTQVLVRLTVRGNASPEATEALIAAELAPVLEAEGLATREAA